MIYRLSTKLLNISIASYCRVQQLQKAEFLIIDAIRLGVIPDVVTYNTLVAAYLRFADIETAYCVLHRMNDAGIKPDVVTYNSLMAAASRFCLLDRMLDLYVEMLQLGIKPDVWSYNTLIYCYFKLGRPDDAYKVFREKIYLSDVSPSAATVNIMITGLCKNQYSNNALMLFRNLQRRGFVPQVVTYNILIHGLWKAGRLKAARTILKELGESGNLPNAITYTAEMKYWFTTRRFERGVEVFLDMRTKGYTYDVFAHCTVIPVLVKLGKMEMASLCVEIMSNGVELDIVAYNTLINFFCRNGKLEDAFKLADEIEKRGFKHDEYTHTILIDGLCKAGKINEALQRLNHMIIDGFDSNLVALNCILDGLCKADQTDDAMNMFKKMKVKDSFTYASLVHHLCKKGKFHTASELLLTCLRSGMKILRSAQRAIIDGLRDSGCTGEARRLQLKIQSARILQKWYI